MPGEKRGGQRIALLGDSRGTVFCCTATDTRLILIGLV
jgi:hypothetical protein